MKVVKSCLLSLTALLAFTFTKAQTVEEIVAKHIDAIGGKEKLNQINSIYIESSLQIMGNEAPSTVTILNGKGYKSETEFNGSKIIQCYTDKGGWSTNPMTGAGPEAMPNEQYKSGKDNFEIGGALFNYAEKNNKVELLGKENNAYKLKVVTKDSAETTYFIDASTYYITKAIKKGNMMGQDVEITVNLSDYRKTETGYVMPFTIELDFGGQFSLSTVVKKVEFNKPVDASIFEMPK